MKSTSSNITRFLKYQADRNPQLIALKTPIRHSGDKILYAEKSFSQLETQTNAAALYLETNGIQKNTKVLLAVKPGLELILITFALFKLGAIPVVIDPGMGIKNLIKCIKSAQPSALIGIPFSQIISHLFFNTFSCLKKRIWIKKNFTHKISKFENLPFKVVDSKSDDLAAILFTSGSTGPPKGVCYEHGMFEAQVNLLRKHYKIEEGEVDLPMLPIFALFNPALGMTTVIPEINPSRPATVDPYKIVTAIKQNNITNSFGSPTLWKIIAKYCEEKNVTLPSLKRILMAGAPVPPDLIRRYKKIIPNGKVHSPYGATEALPITSISGNEVLNSTAELTVAGQGTCVGHTFPHIEVKIIAIDDNPIRNYSTDLELDNGQVGEIIVKGPVVTKEYYNLPEATHNSKIKDGNTFWHRMGDLGYLDNENRLWFCGRMAERVDTDEKTFLTDCCEAIFNRHPSVARSALIALTSDSTIQPGIVIEIDKHAKKVSTQSLLAELRKLAKSNSTTQEIKHFFFLNSLPVDVRHNAKIHRLTLSQLFSKK